jgi:Helicase associated domain
MIKFGLRTLFCTHPLVLSSMSLRSRLSEWGFNWDFKVKAKINRAVKAPWEQRYGELLAYKVENGTTLVPQNHPVLGQWVHSQRNHYRLMMSGLKSPMTEERLHKLNRIGFCFGTVRGGSASVARRKALASAQYDQHSHQLHQQQHGNFESGEDTEDVDEEAETDSSALQKGRQDFCQMQHVLDWERYRTNAS